jgi:hypothetical protein
MAGLICQHVYTNMGTELCNLCGNPSNDLDWNKQNKFMDQWKKDNPNAGYIGWTSI